MDKDILHKEIDLIQSCINRMASNSFLLKGWTVSIVAVVLALASSSLKEEILALILFAPILCFWFLDAFFLQTERKYRKLYSWVLKNRNENNQDMLYDLNPNRFSKEVDCIIKVMFSKTLFAFYFIPLLMVLIIFFKLRNG